MSELRRHVAANFTKTAGAKRTYRILASLRKKGLGGIRSKPPRQVLRHGIRAAERGEAGVRSMMSLSRRGDPSRHVPTGGWKAHLRKGLGDMRKRIESGGRTIRPPRKP